MALFLRHPESPRFASRAEGSGEDCQCTPREIPFDSLRSLRAGSSLRLEKAASLRMTPASCPQQSHCGLRVLFLIARLARNPGRGVRGYKIILRAEESPFFLKKRLLRFL
jgi:hypothetical protein